MIDSLFKIRTLLIMNYSGLIKKAWDLTDVTPKLKWFAFVPAFVGVLVFVLEVLWQLYFYSAEFGLIDSRFSLENVGNIVSFLWEHDLMMWVVFVVIFVILFAFVLPSLIQAVMILGVGQGFDFPDKYLSLRKKVVDGWHYFFRIFELHALLAPFEFLSIVFFVATFYRYFHGELFQFFSSFFVFYLAVSLVIQIFFAFAPYFIVKEDMSLWAALQASWSLVFMNFGVALMLILLMFLVSLRVIINVVVILGVPLALVGVFSYFASSFLIVLSVIFSVGMVGFAAYLTAILEVFSTALWERAFVELRGRQREL